MNNNISFGANFIQKLPVQKYSFKNKKYIPAYANLIEINPHDIQDVTALNNIAKAFGDDNYVNNISYDAKLAYKRHSTNERFAAFLLTKQSGNFENIDANKVLGAAEILRVKNREIDLVYLQTDPFLVYSLLPRTVKNVGGAILDYLKQTNDKISLIATSAERFYLKNGFKPVSSDCSLLVWSKKPGK